MLSYINLQRDRSRLLPFIDLETASTASWSAQRHPTHVAAEQANVAHDLFELLKILPNDKASSEELKSILHENRDFHNFVS